MSSEFHEERVWFGWESLGTEDLSRVTSALPHIEHRAVPNLGTHVAQVGLDSVQDIHALRVALEALGPSSSQYLRMSIVSDAWGDCMVAPPDILSLIRDLDVPVRFTFTAVNLPWPPPDCAIEPGIVYWFGARTACSRPGDRAAGQLVVGRPGSSLGRLTLGAEPSIDRISDHIGRFPQQSEWELGVILATENDSDGVALDRSVPKILKAVDAALVTEYVVVSAECIEE